jgi:hypothetical protein
MRILKNRKAKWNIFLITGPLVKVASKSLLESGQLDECQRNICFIFSKSKVASWLPNCDVYYFDTSSWKKYLKAMLVFKKIIRSVEEVDIEVDVYLGNAAHFSTNYAVFKMKTQKMFLLPEGIANYYDAQVTKTASRTMQVKWLLGKLIGLPFSQYRGHISGYEVAKYDAVYTFNPRGLVTVAQETRQLHYQPVTVSNNIKEQHAKSDLLFLDQNIESLISTKKATELRADAKMYILKHAFDVVYYKKHPSQQEDRFKEIAELGIKVVELVDGRPVEEMIHEIMPSEIVSFVSSALLTISDMYPMIRCTSIGLATFVSEGATPELEPIFRHKEINLV